MMMIDPSSDAMDSDARERCGFIVAWLVNKIESIIVGDPLWTVLRTNLRMSWTLGRFLEGCLQCNPRFAEPFACAVHMASMREYVRELAIRFGYHWKALDFAVKYRKAEDEFVVTAFDRDIDKRVKTCRAACIAMLHRKNNTHQWLNRDMRLMIAQLMWESRITKAWDPSKRISPRKTAKKKRKV